MMTTLKELQTTDTTERFTELKLVGACKNVPHTTNLPAGYAQ